MNYSSESIERAVEMLSSLPSIGRKTAQRLVYYMLRQNGDYILNISKSLVDLIGNIHLCEECFNYTDVSPCPICSSEKRDNDVICVVAEPNDVLVIEKTNEYKGKYHILHGILNPLEGVSPSDLKIRELIERAANVSEVILAINPSIEGEITIQYIAKLLLPLGIKVSRLAKGIPIGANIEYTDEATISQALEGRTYLNR